MCFGIIVSAICDSVKNESDNRAKVEIEKIKSEEIKYGKMIDAQDKQAQREMRMKAIEEAFMIINAPLERRLNMLEKYHDALCQNFLTNPENMDKYISEFQRVDQQMAEIQISSSSEEKNLVLSPIKSQLEMARKELKTFEQSASNKNSPQYIQHISSLKEKIQRLEKNFQNLQLDGNNNTPKSIALTQEIDNFLNEMNDLDQIEL